MFVLVMTEEVAVNGRGARGRVRPDNGSQEGFFKGRKVSFGSCPILGLCTWRFNSPSSAHQQQCLIRRRRCHPRTHQKKKAQSGSPSSLNTGLILCIRKISMRRI